ncbi:hypothetical protein Xen7305DRAFT_00026870 [Xenococcus sp. PCC 7305]|uniref:hypothetical protein n=1 Tax=Xenococcus sp. PCC 7305 TaxID=102125 RepID=UPI0002ABADA3|nr:hypothetical protein [Xenococcus sp. PCC 7305]ELS02969.1 hypothetical protein Xen7305DRAFT_00026870 [Xenococcus sp. PCC 7305]
MPTSNLEAKQENSVSVQAIEEIALTIAAKDLNPTMMSQDFLKMSGIIDQDWELAQQPILNPNAAQLSFKNGINITAQPNSVTITESISQKKLEEVTAGAVATKFVAKLPYGDYLGYSFSPKMLLPFPKNPQQARNYITGNLLAQGAWKNIGKTPVQAGINLMYSLEHCQLNISIAEARLQQAQQPPMMAILFSGGFNYNLSTISDSQEKLAQLNKAISSWQNDFGQFRNIITQKFLGSSAVPETQSADDTNLFPMGDTL